jgi:serine protease AprX
MNHRPRKRGRLFMTVMALALVPGLGLTTPAGGTLSAAVRTSSPGLSSAWLGNWRDDNASGADLWDIRNMLQLGWGASAGLAGDGVGIALIDTGVAPVWELSPQSIVNGPDLSFESQSPDLRYLDTYGHGTHMAGIMVGNGYGFGNLGIAYKSKLTSIKVGTSDGTVDVSQVIAAIDWVVENRNHDPAFPIRVINLSYGSGGNPSSTTDPLQFAVEQAWKAGIVVVAAAGNNSNAVMSNPATDPFILAIGAARTAGTDTNADDTVSTFTNGKAATRSFDLVAPGEGIYSLRVPGSNIDNLYPGARIDDRVFRGSGTSQATAIASAAVAVLLQARPTLTANQVKHILRSSGTPLSGLDAGKKMINVNAALATAAPTVVQYGQVSTGTGSLEAARGNNHVVHNDRVLMGENSIFGPFSSRTWAAQSAYQNSWVGGVWMGHRFAGDGWTGTSWASKTWAPATWTGASFSGGSWVDPNWEGRFWSGRFWSGGTWVGRFWSSGSWYSTP